jgi:hypothetical protein
MRQMVDSPAIPAGCGKFVLFNLVNSTALKKPASKSLILVRPDGFEPPTTWFEEAYSKQRKYLENKAFWQIGCATKPPVTP